MNARESMAHLMKPTELSAIFVGDFQELAHYMY